MVVDLVAAKKKVEEEITKEKYLVYLLETKKGLINFYYIIYTALLQK